MKVSPLDLRQQRFRTVLRGYDPSAVDALLVEVSEDYERALREADRLRQELARAEALVNEHREHERNLRNTLLTAQRLADEIREKAERDAHRIVDEADSRSDLLLQKVQTRLEDGQRQIDGLKLKRRDVEATLESTIGVLQNALSFVRDQDQKDREERILLHRPRPNETGQPPLRPIDAALEVGERKTQS
jgi:cell division initiation protein